jgi:hypothetical protein
LSPPFSQPGLLLPVWGWLVGAKDLATVKERAEFLKDAALTSNV